MRAATASSRPPPSLPSIADASRPCLTRPPRIAVTGFTTTADDERNPPDLTADSSPGPGSLPKGNY